MYTGRGKTLNIQLYILYVQQNQTNYFQHSKQYSWSETAKWRIQFSYQHSLERNSGNYHSLKKTMHSHEKNMLCIKILLFLEMMYRLKKNLNLILKTLCMCQQHG